MRRASRSIAASARLMVDGIDSLAGDPATTAARPDGWGWDWDRWRRRV